MKKLPKPIMAYKFTVFALINDDDGKPYVAYCMNEQVGPLVSIIKKNTVTFVLPTPTQRKRYFSWAKP